MYFKSGYYEFIPAEEMAWVLKLSPNVKHGGDFYMIERCIVRCPNKKIQ